MQKLSKYFSLQELTYLRSWDTFHTPNQKELENLTKLALAMDTVREFIGNPIIVHCGIRPILNNINSEYHGKDYNEFIIGSPKSLHKIGLAIDFHVANMDCDKVRELIVPKLEEWKMRCEDLPGSNWVHIDLGSIKSKRFFKP